MKNQITYTEHNELYYPALTLPEQTNYTFGKYAKLFENYFVKDCFINSVGGTMLTAVTMVA